MGTLSRIIDSIFPPRCLLCGTVTHSDEKCCQRCHAILKRPSETYDYKVISGTKTVVPFIYNSESSHIIVDLKRNGDENIAKYLGEAMANEVRKVYSEVKFDVVTDVPMSKKKYNEMGFNHSELLSKVVAKNLDIKHMPNLLMRTDDSRPQHELGMTERVVNANESYEIWDKTDLTGKNVLLIDDIITTGATLEVCSRLLLEMGASKVYCCVAMGK